MRPNDHPGSSSVQRQPRAIDIMGGSADDISARASVQICQQKMHQLNVDCLTVLDGDRVVGVISHWDVEKALEHRLGSEPVNNFMSSPAITVRPGTSFARIHRLMAENRIGHLPVLGPGGLMGMISRSDLLRAWPSGQRPDSERQLSFARTENLSGLMRKRMSPRVQRVLRQIGRMGQQVGVDVFLVGGCVRDLLLNFPDVDLDIVVAGDGMVFAEEFVSEYGGQVVFYRRFATALMILPGKLKIDVVSARCERYKSPGALPSIAPGALINDLYRRDFTINSMALQLSGRHFGMLVDPFGGRRDLLGKTIRVMHNLSFVEDPTRIIRAVRFVGRYGFHMDGRTLHLLSSAARTHMLDRISGQRLREEILILLREKNPIPAINRLDRLGVLNSLSPDLEVTAGLSRLLKRIYNRLRWLESLRPEVSLECWIVFLVGLFSGLPFPEMERLATRLSLHRKARECLRQARRAEDEVCESLGSVRRPPNSELYRLLHYLRPEVLIYLMARSQSRAVAGRIVYYLVHLRDIHLEIGGDDLKKMGLIQGAVYNRILSRILMAKLDGHLRDRSAELDLAARLVQARKQ